MQANEILIDDSPYKIVDQDGYRLLRVRGDEVACFSTMRLDDPDAVASGYVAAMLHWLVLMPPKDIMEVGLGGGQAAKFIRKHLPDTRLVTVELDPVMVDIAHRYFGLAADDDRLSVVVDDGGAYVRSHPDSCDAMLIDACDSALGFPESLTGEAFCRACHDALRTDGPLLINFFRTSEPWRLDYCRTLAKFFPHMFLTVVSPNQQVLTAFKRLPRFDWALLAQRAEQLEPQLRLGLPSYVATLEACVQGAGQG